METIVWVLARSAHPPVVEVENWKNKYQGCPPICMLKQMRENNTIPLKSNRYPIENTQPTTSPPFPASGPDPFSVCLYSPSNEEDHGR
jgi:hypothetical protein